MSSNESVEGMLKEIKNLLRQQDRDQSKEPGAGLEPVAAESGSPGPAEEKEAEDLPPTPAVEVVDSVESQLSADEAREPAHTATWDPASVGVPGAQGLQVEMVPSDEDWYEIGEPEPEEAGINSEQAPAASETQADAQAGPGLDSSGVAEGLNTEAEAEPVRPDEDVPDDTQASADSMSERPRRRLTARLGTLLRDAHLISERDLERAVAEHQAAGQRLGHYLVAHDMLKDKDLANVLSAQHGVPAADVETLEVPSAVLALVPVKMVRRYMVLPVAVSGGVVDVAMVDPSDSNAIKDLEFTTGLRVQPLIATEWSAERAIERIYGEEELRSTLTGGSAKAAGSTDPRTIIRGMVRDRDEAVLQAERSPHRAYELAASIDDFVDEILKAVEKPQD